MAARGPAPKPKSQRLGNMSKAEIDSVDLVEAGPPAASPPADPDWHPRAVEFYESLAESAQSVYYEASDWAVARILAESISRELSDQPITVGSGADAHLEMVKVPPKGASLAAWLKGMTMLLMTETDRRRASIELQRSAPGDEEATNVSWIEEARQRLNSAG